MWFNSSPLLILWTLQILKNAVTIVSTWRNTWESPMVVDCVFRSMTYFNKTRTQTHSSDISSVTLREMMYRLCELLCSVHEQSQIKSWLLKYFLNNMLTVLFSWNDLVLWIRFIQMKSKLLLILFPHDHLVCKTFLTLPFMTNCIFCRQWTMKWNVINNSEFGPRVVMQLECFRLSADCNYMSLFDNSLYTKIVIV